ncbi:ATP synthase F1 subcomplex gamma subunit [Faecalicatena contorta]|uniref:ATP synthase gamma chain n=2 Tax=Faecalicatena contorta TaxID=39482 RepID=A0A315ZPH4_9FIRM|nr:ATP synthase F1 subcomplex gamma subunit [Faecalicatena contorta]SUQ16154.1 ATP synthase F1 subcomplex gamma subunit [Faecalicatena contorta]
MNSMRDIKQRISNVSSVEQIVKAMDMVASTKLVKARAQLEGVRPICYELKRVVEELGRQKESKNHVFYEERKVKNSLYIILTSNSGLSGSYNANIMARSLKHMNQGKNEKILAVGSRGHEYFKKKNKNIIHAITDMADAQVYYGTERIAKKVMEFYLAGEIEEVFVAYTHFGTVLNYEPIVEKLLPLPMAGMMDEDDGIRKYEPDINTFIDHTIPLYLHMSLFRAFSESHTSEQAARMVNMDAAGKNASEIIEDLTRMYNRKRQANITQELSEIVGGANNLN